MSARISDRSIEKFVRLIKAQGPKTWKTLTSSRSLTSTPAIVTVVALLVSAMLFAIYSSSTQTGIANAATVQKKADTDAARAELVRPTAVTPVAGNSAAKSAAPSTRVTITGCLERSDETFRLTDTSGTNSPTSRSWKSGFLKKRPAKLDVVDGTKRLNLERHVGQRVTVTGTLVDKEIRAGSVQRIAASCEKA